MRRAQAGYPSYIETFGKVSPLNHSLCCSQLCTVFQEITQGFNYVAVIRGNHIRRPKNSVIENEGYIVHYAIYHNAHNVKGSISNLVGNTTTRW